MPSTSRDAGRPRRVLVVDDVDLVRSTLGRQFEHLGCEVVEATNAEEALALVRAAPLGWDLIVSDQKMPGMTGDELLARLRDLCPRTCTVLLSGWGSVRCPAADRVMHKPPSFEDLRDLLSDLDDRDDRGLGVEG